jgi:DNA-binding XRE family transcriptional regulator
MATNPSGSKFSDFYKQVAAEAEAEGPEGVARLEALHQHFRLGRKFAEARVSKRLTQRQVASIAKVDQGDVSRIERGVANPTFETMTAIALAVECELDLKPKSRRR